MISFDLFIKRLKQFSKRLKFIDLTASKTIIIIGIGGGVFFSLSILLFFLVFSNSDNLAISPKQSISHNPNVLSRYYLHPPEKIIDAQPTDYIISPEKVSLSGDKKKLLHNLLESELFTSEEQNVQIEINKLPH